MKIIRKILSIFLLLPFALSAQDARELHENGVKLLSQGDYDNAVMVLTSACDKAPEVTLYAKDLAYAYFLKSDAVNAKRIISKLLDKDDADDRIYLLSGNIHQLSGDYKEAEKTYKKGIKKYENSGLLYNALGELQWNRQEYSAISQWEKGIEKDPAYPGNYYNASKYYFLTAKADDKIWAILYGEIFVNLESFSQRTIEAKTFVLESYKKMFADKQLFNSGKKQIFTEAFTNVLGKHQPVVALGINTGSLLSLRTRFVLEWYNVHATTLPFRLFELHRQLLREGMFEAYHQWLFESVVNVASFENWTRTHADEYAAFNRFRQNRMFKVTTGEYYHP
jgi:tetratricopeptide (TPR) repeat protein